MFLVSSIDINPFFFSFYFNSTAYAWASNGQGVGAHITLTLDREYGLCRIRLLQRPNPFERFQTLRLSFSTGGSQEVSMMALENNQIYLPQYSRAASACYWLWIIKPKGPKNGMHFLKV